MATKTLTGSGEEQKAAGNAAGKAAEVWNNFTRFLSDVRSETRKVVTPSRKEVQATTTVVIAAVFIFGLFFFVVDAVCRVGVDRLLLKLGGLH